MLAHLFVDRIQNTTADSINWPKLRFSWQEQRLATAFRGQNAVGIGSNNCMSHVVSEGQGAFSAMQSGI
jgi:hypothetical protein